MQPVEVHYCIASRVGRSLDKSCHAAANVQVFSGTPEVMLEVSPAYFVPGSICIYDEWGRRIPESCVRRGPGFSEYVSAGRVVIRIPDQCDEVESPALFLSSIPSHWGHFLTEGTSRLWALDQFGELADYQMFYVGPPRHNSVITSFLRLAQIDPRGLTALQRPTRFRKCFVPFPSFSNRACAYTNHANLGKKVAEEALNRGASNKSDQPVYLSRRRWRPGIVRMLRNEDILEERLANHGVRIVYPERLSLEDQIKLLNSHRTFIGCWGSAFHSLILSSHPGKTTTHVICQEPNANLLMFDAILGTSATYLKALSDTPDVSQQWPQLDQQIDVQLVLDYLRCTQMI